jgi:FAD/FMN-containing dehydrogenase
MTLENFGRNVRFGPAVLMTPNDENAVLACLEHHRGRNIRAIGSLHSWSEAAVGPDVVLDLRNLSRVTTKIHGDGSVDAEIEAGCTIDAALDYLQAHGGYTLPTHGIIGKQTMAGAIATATHGSGRASLSHYVSAISAAAYDKDSGQARIYQWAEGEELRAARCGLGCTGILLSIRMRVEPDYLIEENTQWFERLEDVLEQECNYPRQQFYLVPWSWRWFAQRRRALSPESGATASATAPFHRVFRRVGVDVVFNGVVKLLSATFRSSNGIRWLYRRAFPLIARSGMTVTDRSRHMLMMRHDLYRHVEMELFVASPHVSHAAAFVEWVLRWCGGESPRLPESLARDDYGRNVTSEIEALRDSYVHDYLITFRRVLRDEALISMTSGEEDVAWYAISLITYRRDLGPFLTMARFMATTMAFAYGARPHWGKVCPLSTEELAALYPSLPRFRAVCASVDAGQLFVNDFARRALGF